MHIGQALVAPRNKRAKPGVRVAQNKTPRELLEDLINRSGLTQTAVANLLGFSHTSGLNRYTREQTQGDRPIAVNIVKKLLPVLVGRGNPPITTDEVMSLTTLTGSGEATTAAAPAGPSLQVRYRVEKGTYVKLGDQSAIGPAPICCAADFAPYSQFVVAQGRKYLHCVDKAQFSPGALMGKRAVVAVPFEKTSLHEIMVERVSEKMSGRVLGIVIGTYERE